MDQKKWPVLYRYWDEATPQGVKIRCDRYAVIRETEKCYFVVRAGMESYVTYAEKGEPWAKRWLAKYTKRVLKDQNGRRLCYTDRKRAMHSYMIRKTRQAQHLRRTLDQANLAMRKAVDLAELDDPGIEDINCGHTDYTQLLQWGDY